MNGWRRAIGDRHPAPFRAKPTQALTDDGAVRGLPLGGLGTGSIGRDHDGRFARWHLAPGAYRHRHSPGSWLAVEVADGAGPVALVAPGTPTRPEGLAPPAGDVGEYEALFPFSWYRYRPEVTGGVRVAVRQWSPVLPRREEESGWPVGVLEVTLTGPADRATEVTIALALELPLPELGQEQPARVELRASAGLAEARLPDVPGSMALAVEAGAAATAARPLRGDADYRTLSGGLWAAATRPAPAAPSPEAGDGPGLLVAARVRLRPHESRTVAFALAWDLPVVRFGARREHAWYRSHTRRFGRDGRAAADIARTTLSRRGELAACAEGWHAELSGCLRRWGAPEWLLPALCNELYVLVEAGTAWVVGEVGGEPEEHFAVLESVDYRFYETLDVRYYSSFALLELWPRLERLVIADYLRTVPISDDEPVRAVWDGSTGPRKRRGAAPHDLGGPFAAPFRQVNAYDLHDSGLWRDLNPKLVLQVVRDACMLEAGDLAVEAWPACRAAIRYVEAFDTDGDGLLDHDGRPDQTYDTWPMTGVSAYCADLWLACLAAGEWLARRAGDEAEADRLAGVRERARWAAEAALWNGSHYRFDSAAGPASEAVMADQLAGTWYTKLLGLPTPHPAGRSELALDTVLASNLRGFAGGRLGPVNGRSPDGGPVAVASEQAHEVWVGVGWALASLALLMGRDEDAWQIGRALHTTLYEQSGLWFRTPEAWTEDRQFRAAMYHRPLAVWSVYTALRLRSGQAQPVPMGRRGA